MHNERCFLLSKFTPYMAGPRVLASYNGLKLLVYFYFLVFSNLKLESFSGNVARFSLEKKIESKRRFYS